MTHAPVNLRLLVDSPTLSVDIEVTTPPPPVPSPNGFDFHIYCQHCGNECGTLNAPLACGHIICDCHCPHWHDCPGEGTQQSHMVSFHRVLLELLTAVPTYNDTDYTDSV